MLNKTGLIGGGYIGGVLAHEIAERKLAREVGLVDPAPFVNPEDVKFFLDWAKEAAGKNIAPTEEQRVLFDRYSEETIKFWEEMYRSASE